MKLTVFLTVLWAVLYRNFACINELRGQEIIEWE